MTFEDTKVKILFPTILLILAHLSFFIWRDHTDPLSGYRHLMLQIMIISIGLAAVFGFLVFRSARPGLYGNIDIWVVLFTLLVILNVKKEYSTLLTDKNLLTYVTCIGVYAVIRLNSKYLLNGKFVLYGMLALASVETGFLLVEGFRLLNNTGWPLPAFRGSFVNSGMLGNYLAILFPLQLYTLQKVNGRNLVYKIILALLLSDILFLVLSQSRIGWLSVFISTVLIIPWYIQNRKKKILFYLSAAVFAILLAVVILAIKLDSAAGRLLIWDITAHHLDDYRIQGAGHGKFASLYNLWQADYFSIRDINDRYFYIADNTFFAFNEFLQTAIELGWPGGLMWLFLLVYVSGKISKRNIWSVPVFAFLILCFASYPFREMRTQLLFFSLLACFANNDCRTGKSYASGGKVWLAGVLYRCLYISGVLCWSIAGSFCLLQLRSTYTWNEARNEFSFDGKKGKALYGAAFSRLRHNPEFLLEYGTRLIEENELYAAKKTLEHSKRSFVSQIHQVELGYCYEQMAEYGPAEKHYLDAVYISPSKLAPRYQLLLFYDRTGRMRDAVSAGETIMKIRPKIRSNERGRLIKEAVEKYLKKHP